MTVEPTSGLPMHMGLCRGHVGVVWWVWFDRAVGFHTLFHTFVHIITAVNEGVNRCGAGTTNGIKHHRCVSDMPGHHILTTLDHVARLFTAINRAFS